MRRLAWLFLALPLTGLAGVFYPEGATTLHFAFDGSPNGDRPIVRPPSPYHPSAGFGFVDSPELIGTANGVQAPAYFRFDADLPPGNYDVTVRMGSPLAASTATVKAETHRPYLLNVQTAARGNTEATFTVNVRASTRFIDKKILLDNRLTLEFAGTNPSLLKLDIRPNTTAPTVFVVGANAAAADYDLPQAAGEAPVAGWGQMLPMFFKPTTSALANWAMPLPPPPAPPPQPGTTVVGAGPTPPIFENALKSGDFVLLAISRDTNAGLPQTSQAFRLMMTPFINQCRQKGAQLILATPLPTYAGEPPQLVANPFLPWIKEVAEQEKLPLIDLHAAADKSLRPLLLKRPASLALTPHAAYETAKLISQLLREGNTPLSSLLYTDAPAIDLDPAHFPPTLSPRQ